MLTFTSRHLQRWSGEAVKHAFTARAHCLLQGPDYSPTSSIDEVTESSSQADYVSTFLNMINVLAVRLSVLCLYRRIFITQTFRRITLALGVIIVLHVLLIMIAGAIRCLPVASIWDRSVPSDFCINYSAGFLWGMIINACIDAAILCLPIVMIRRLQLRSAKKMALIGIFLLGAG